MSQLFVVRSSYCRRVGDQHSRASRRVRDDDVQNLTRVTLLTLNTSDKPHFFHQKQRFSKKIPSGALSVIFSNLRSS